MFSLNGIVYWNINCFLKFSSMCQSYLWMVHSLKDVVLLNPNIFKVLLSRGSSKTKVLQYYNLYLINIKLEILFHEAVFFFFFFFSWCKCKYPLYCTLCYHCVLCSIFFFLVFALYFLFHCLNGKHFFLSLTV